MITLATASRRSSVSVTSASALYTSKKYITRLYTSYYPGQLFPTQLVPRKQRLPRNWKSTVTVNQMKKAAGCSVAGDDSIFKELRNKEEENALMLMEEANEKTVKSAHKKSERPYFPLAEAAKIELQGDYLTEGDLHQEALEHYGVVAKAYQLAYPANHSQQISICVKLCGALRRTGRLKSSKKHLERAVKMCDDSDRLSTELIVETLLELGLTLEALGDPAAGEAYEEAVLIVQQFHDLGASHKMLRLLPKLGRRFNLNAEEKFLYYSPFDWDRTYALADQCLHRATEFYRSKGEREAVIRVLKTRVELMDKKFFNMRDFAGRIHTMRGHWMRRARHLTDAPTPDELLRYSPTIHQVYRDFKYELNSPIGRENEVASGTNRVVLDMGNPYRQRGRQAREMMRDADYNFKKYVRNQAFGDRP